MRKKGTCVHTQPLSPDHLVSCPDALNRSPSDYFASLWDIIWSKHSNEFKFFFRLFSFLFFFFLPPPRPPPAPPLAQSGQEATGQRWGLEPGRERLAMRPFFHGAHLPAWQPRHGGRWSSTCHTRHPAPALGPRSARTKRLVGKVREKD